MMDEYWFKKYRRTYSKFIAEAIRNGWKFSQLRKYRGIM